MRISRSAWGKGGEGWMESWGELEGSSGSMGYLPTQRAEKNLRVRVVRLA